MQTCSTCKQEFPLTAEYWHKNKTRLSGFSSTCKECAKARARQWLIDNPERSQKTRKRYYIENKDKFAETAKARRLDPEKRAMDDKRAAEWRKANPEQARKIANRYARSERGRQITSQWRTNNYEHYANQNRKHKHIRRARVVSAGGTFTAADMRRQYAMQRGKCWYCGVDLSTVVWHSDHLIPLKRGGSNDASNIVCACKDCNLSKGAKLPHEWIGRLL